MFPAELDKDIVVHKLEAEQGMSSSKPQACSPFISEYTNTYLKDAFFYNVHLTSYVAFSADIVSRTEDL